MSTRALSLAPLNSLHHICRFLHRWLSLLDHRSAAFKNSSACTACAECGHEGE
jgi:hypothetical protein